MMSTRSSESSPELEIQVFECEACGSTTEDLSYQRPLNSLEGRVQIYAKSELHFTRVGVSFQGGVRPEHRETCQVNTKVRRVGSQSTSVVAYRPDSQDVVSLESEHKVGERLLRERHTLSPSPISFSTSYIGQPWILSATPDAGMEYLPTTSTIRSSFRKEPNTSTETFHRNVSSSLPLVTPPDP